MTKTITGSFRTTSNANIPLGIGASTLQLTLSALATANGSAQLSPAMVSVALSTNSVIPGSTLIWANEELLPNNTTYRCRIIDGSNNILWGPATLNISGNSPIDLTTIAPVP